MEIKEQKKDPYASIAQKTNSKEKYVKLSKKEMKKKLELLQIQKEKERENKITRKIVFPNIPNLKQKESIIFEKDALIKDFENGYKAMLIYLNERFSSQIPVIIDPHKMTINLEAIPKLSKNAFSTSFYIKKLEESLYDLKKMCYEMKLNGINRILLPISANIEFTTQVKIVYDNHVNIDKIMGDTLKVEQYIFIYDKIDFISKSNLHSELLLAKDKYLMEIGISKFIFYEALCHSLEVLLHMRTNNRLNQIKYDNIDNYFQLTKLCLDPLNDFNSFNYYNFDNYTHDITKIYATEIKNEIKKNKLILLEEIKKYGRFFILENFMDPNEKNNWIKLVNQLIEINLLVREDIRDYLLKNPKNIKKNKMITNESSSLNESNIQNTERNIRNKNSPKKHSKKGSRHLSRRNSRNISVKKSSIKPNNINIQIDDDENNYLKNINMTKLKPPFVWNFPVWKVKSLQKQRNLTTVWGNEINTGVPDFDKLYVDGRIQKFLELFEIMFNNNMTYCKEKMNNNWEYMLYKQYEIFGINYGPFKNKFYRKIDLVPQKPKNPYDEEDKKKDDEIEEDIQIDN